MEEQPPPLGVETVCRLCNFAIFETGRIEDHAHRAVGVDERYGARFELHDHFPDEGTERVIKQLCGADRYHEVLARRFRWR